MKTILAPTDFSKISENAVHYAAEMAKATHSKLILLHAYTISVPAYDVPIIPVPFEEMEKEYYSTLNDFDKKIKKKYGNIETQLLVKPGFVVDEINAEIENDKIDIVVMGITGAGKTTSILGSNTTSIMKKSTCPILVIPENVSFKKPKNIAIACDFKAIIPTHVVEHFSDFVRAFGAKIFIFDVLKKAEILSYQKAAAEVNLENALVDLEHTIYFASSDDLPQEVGEFVTKNNIDILTVMPHNYNFISGLFHQSTSKQIALYTHIPILSLHE
ncbi:MAG TPA: universal stress protein [Bacteroidia bacterium]|nr:universal stress protein [Bacteroidia bacterium]